MIKNRKFAFIVDRCAISSYYIKDGKSYSYKDDKFYMCDNSLSESAMIGMWCYPFIYEDGCFLNWSEWGDNLPDYDLDTIIVAIDKDFVNCNVDKLRKKYPNAYIFGMPKEVFIGGMTDMGYTLDPSSEKHKNRTKFLNQCDGIVQCFHELDNSPLEYLREECHNKPMEYLPFPVDVDYMYDNYYKDKTEGVYVYLPCSHGRRRNTIEFAQHISKKYQIPIDSKPLYPDRPYNWMSLHDLVSMWSKYSLHVNLDSADWFPGSQGIQVATTGTIQVGGLNYSHRLLYPDMAISDLDLLETRVDKIMNDYDYRIELITEAFDKVQKYYSFDVCRKALENIKGRVI